MRLRIKKPSSRFPNKTTTRLRDRGYALLIVMMVVTVLLISLSAALPSVYVEGQREREEELVFRGNQYARAIATFRRRFNRFPTSVDELLHTSGVRFLRHAYRDPMTKDGKWRFIHGTATGLVLNAGVGTGSPNDPSSDSRAIGRRPFGSRGGDRRSTGLLGDNESNSNKEEKGGFITGVASLSHKESLRVWKNHTHYDEWEFLGTDFAPAGLAPQPAGGRVGTSDRPFGRQPRVPPNPRGFPPDLRQ